MTSDVLENAVERLRKTGIELPRLEARLMLAAAMSISQEEVVSGRSQPEPSHLAKLNAMLLRREAREPLAYILGKREFWSIDFVVGPGALIPRPESETLIETALAEFPFADLPLRVLDLGTGTGCLLIAFLKERPQAFGVGVDISDMALAWASRNLGLHGMTNRARLSCADWTKRVEGTFDVILCNPPYVTDAERALLAPEVAQYEPEIALAAGKDGLDAYRQLATQIGSWLRPEGRAFVEVGKGQAMDVAAIFGDSCLDVVSIIPDLAQIPRVLVIGLQQ